MGILDQFDLSGKTALVTGCRRGIGRAFAQGLAEAGADIVGVSASLEPGSEVEQDVTGLGRPFKSYGCDFSDRDALHAFIAQVKADFDQIDFLINNAGITKDNLLIKMNNDAIVIICLGLSALIKNSIGLKKIPPPIPTTPETKPKAPPIKIETTVGIFL